MTTTDWQSLIEEAKKGGGGFDPLPNGPYDVQIVEASAATTSTGKTMFKVKAKVIAGPHAGRYIWNNFTVSPENPNALSFFFQHMAILGLDANFFAQAAAIQQQQGPEASNQFVASNMLNKTCQFHVETGRIYNGQPQMDVKKVLPATPGVVAGGPAAPGEMQMAAPAAYAPAPAPAPVPVAAAPVAPPVAAPAPAPVAAPVAPPVPAPAPAAAPAPAPAPMPAPAPVAAPAPAPMPAPAPAPAPVVAEVPAAAVPAPAPVAAPVAAVLPEVPAPGAPPAPPF